MDEETLDWAFAAVKNSERRKCAERLLKGEGEEATQKGNNYASDMFRLKLRVVNKGGETEERSVIYKSLPLTERRRWGIKWTGVFEKESRIYTDVLPEMEKLIRTCEGSNDTMWAECLGVRGNKEAILFQDLKTLGYKVADRLKGLDLTHMELTMEALAKFHALSAVLIERMDISRHDFNSHYFTTIESEHPAHELISTNIGHLVKTINDEWKGEWVEYVPALEAISKNIIEILQEAAADKSKFRVLNHGDCWVNNIMFKYDRNERPRSVKFVDFQFTYVNGPGFDLQYLICTSLQVSEMGRIDELIERYWRTLDECLTTYGLRAPNPTLEDIRDNFNHWGRFGIAISICFRPLMMLPSSAAPDMEEMNKKINEGEKPPLAPYDFDSEDYRTAIQYIVKKAKDQKIS